MNSILYHLTLIIKTIPLLSVLFFHFSYSAEFTVQELRYHVGTKGEEISPIGFYRPGDKNGGPLRLWSPDSLCTNDSVSCIRPISINEKKPGRWIWKETRLTYPKYWGALKTKEDNSKQLQNMLTYCSLVSCEIIWDSIYKIKNNLYINSNTTITGTTNGGLKQNFSKPGKVMITNLISIPLNNVSIKSLYFDRRGKYGEHAILLANAKNINILNNTIVGDDKTKGGGIGISSFDDYALYPSKDINISMNSLTFTGNYGIQIGNVQNWKVTKNRLTNCYRECVGVEPHSMGPISLLRNHYAYTHEEKRDLNTEVVLYTKDIKDISHIKNGTFFKIRRNKSNKTINFFRYKDNKNYSQLFLKRKEKHVKLYQSGYNSNGIVYKNTVLNNSHLISDGSSTGLFILTQTSLGVIDNILVKENCTIETNAKMGHMSYALFGGSNIKLLNNFALNSPKIAFFISRGVINGLKDTPKPAVNVYPYNIILDSNYAKGYKKHGLFISYTRDSQFINNTFLSKKTKNSLKIERNNSNILIKSNDKGMKNDCY